MALPYSEKVIEYFRNPKNVGEIDDADAIATEGSPACGDMVKLFLKGQWLIKETQCGARE
ncbi:MAG: iron-sulfur cluster assembly scaffold protein [Spirochaetota bacterium]|nr:MAG: iron-sulfur cluster assembly scaffold protein [Spirochaetota bacterium]